MWDHLLSHPSTRAYLMQFPPSTWEEKTIEALQHGINTVKHNKPIRAIKPGHTTSHKPQRKHQSHHLHRATTLKPSSSLPSSHPSTHSSTSITSSPSLPAQSKVLITPPHYDSTSPHLHVHPIPVPRPSSYADEYYQSSPFLTTSQLMSAEVRRRMMPRRVGRNERNVSDVTMLHHHEYGGGVGGGLVSAQKEKKWVGVGARAGAGAGVVLEERRVVRDEAVQVEDEEDGGEGEVEMVAPTMREVTGRGEQEGPQWRVFGDKGSNDIIINVQCQHPHPHAYPAPPPPALLPAPLLPSTSALPPSLPPPHPPVRRRRRSPIRSVPLPPPPAPTPFYSSPAPARPVVHPSYLHPHAVYPEWWPSEEELRERERREEQVKREEEEREGRRREERRRENARVKGVATHQCPPPPARGREGVEGKEERRVRERREEEVRRREREVGRLRGEEEVNVLEERPGRRAWGEVSVPRLMDRERNEGLAWTIPLRATDPPPPLNPERPVSQVPRSRAATTAFGGWDESSLSERPIRSSIGVSGAYPTSSSSAFSPSVPSSSAVGHTGTINYATLLKQLTADPIITSFATSTSSSSPSSLTPRTSALARVAAVSGVAAVEAIRRGKGEKDEDVEGGRREWEVLKAKEVERGWEEEERRGGGGGGGRGWGEVVVEDEGEGEASEADRLYAELSSSQSIPTPLSTSSSSAD